MPLGICVDTGTLERVANWSPDSVATADPCDPGTDSKNGPFAGIPPAIPLNLVLHGNVLEAVLVRRRLLHSLAEVSWSTRTTVFRRAVGYVLVSFGSLSLAFTNVFCWNFCGRFDFVSVPNNVFSNIFLIVFQVVHARFPALLFSTERSWCLVERQIVPGGV